MSLAVDAQLAAADAYLATLGKRREPRSPYTCGDCGFDAVQYFVGPNGSGLSPDTAWLRRESMGMFEQHLKPATKTIAWRWPMMWRPKDGLVVT
jgi:hypothetical protein